MNKSYNHNIYQLTVISLLIISSLLFHSCSKSKAVNETTIDKKAYVAEKNEVETIVFKNESFQKELVSNGKIIAAQKKTECNLK
jgi:hypothetical protein